MAVLGCGNVGSALVGIVQDRAGSWPSRAAPASRSAASPSATLAVGREPHIPEELLTTDAAALVVDPTIDVVVELIGGLDPAGKLVRSALDAGKPVVTANKALLASPEGVALRALAKKRGVDLLYEAAVAGAIPLVRALRESLTGERIHRVMGIVNGTTNFILTKMAEQGADYADVLAEAQALGLAERDPTADVEGYDAAAKAAILAGVAFGYDVAGDEVMREGITGIRTVDVEFAERAGLHRQAPGHRGTHRRRRPLGQGPSRPRAPLPSAGRGPRRLQRRLHRGGGSRRVDALRPRGGGAAHGQRGGR